MNLNMGGFIGAAVGAAIGFLVGKNVWNLGNAGTALVVGLVAGAIVGNVAWAALSRK